MTFRERFDQWFCRAGWHQWGQPTGPLDVFPVHRDPSPTRTCTNCGATERWLPGYGGSEVGCWIKTER